LFAVASNSDEERQNPNSINCFLVKADRSNI